MALWLSLRFNCVSHPLAVHTSKLEGMRTTKANSCLWHSGSRRHAHPVSLRPNSATRAQRFRLRFLPPLYELHHSISILCDALQLRRCIVVNAVTVVFMDWVEQSHPDCQTLYKEHVLSCLTLRSHGFQLHHLNFFSQNNDRAGRHNSHCELWTHLNINKSVIDKIKCAKTAQVIV